MNLRSSIIFCDDIRTEINGKLILIGVYADGLIPGVLPQTVLLSVHLRIWDLPVGHHKLAFALTVDGKGEEPKQFDVYVPNNPGLIQINLLGLPAVIIQPSNVTFAITGLPEGQKISEVLKVILAIPQPGNLIAPLIN
jgi:hypothetical protein